MEPSINTQKIQAMTNYKRAKLAYNLSLYALISIITCFFVSSPFWFPSITNHLFISTIINAKCLFVLGNLIVIILVGESKLKQQSASSSTSDFYDEYVARSCRRSSHHKEMVDGSVKTLNVEEKIHHHQQEKKKLEIKINSMPHGKEKKKGMRSCKSEVWGESGMVKIEKTKGKKEQRLFERENIKMGMRSSKSAVWSESVAAIMEKGKGKKEEQCVKASKINGDIEKKMGMSSKSKVWGEKMERGCKGNKEEQSSKNITQHQEEKKMETMRSSRSAVWGESEIVDKEQHMQEEKMMKVGMRSCRSEIWSESELERLGKSTHVAKEEEQQLNVLNKRVEDFIARVNKQRLLEAKIVDHGRG